LSPLSVPGSTQTRYDILALGEVMLRLDPGASRIRDTRTFDVWEGGGEYNVARAAAACYGLRAGIVTALVDNEIGQLIAGLIRRGGADTSQIVWVPDDGIGRSARNGLNFTERGFGVRRALGVSDRAHTAVSQLRPGDIDWDRLFGDIGARWFHTGGVFAGLTSETAEVAQEAMAAARRHGTVVSYDVNYRPSLWQGRGGAEAAVEVGRRLTKHADVLIGNEGHFGGLLGVPLPTNGSDEPDIHQILSATQAEFPHLSLIAATRRTEHSASRIDWGAAVWDGDHVASSVTHHDLEVFDRVGGGDGFVAGLLAGVLGGRDLGAATSLGVAHGALAMTTPGDNSMARPEEVEALAFGVMANRR
jgi:2-dehydro-3-deoxygluconokinase